MPHDMQNSLLEEGSRGVSRPLELAVIIPTLNEVENIPVLLDRLKRTLQGVEWEAIIVDDNSRDATADLVRSIASRDRRVRCIERIGRRGLASACIEGALATSAPVFALMDGDLQHDERLLPDMLRTLDDGDLDLVVASRFTEGGKSDGLADDRLWKSKLATRLSMALLGAELKDPMSGFFMMKTERFRSIAPKLTGVGFKILLDIFLTAGRPLKFAELGYTFRERNAGASKLDSAVALELLILLYEKSLGRFIPTRFAMFSLIGGLGVFVHMAILSAAYVVGGQSFVIAQAVATIGAMTFNFFLNNLLTYRDRRLRGWRPLLLGWLSFCAVCGGGALANVGVAAFLHDAQDAHWTLSALGGIAIGAVWNYALSSKFTWGRY